MKRTVTWGHWGVSLYEGDVWHDPNQAQLRGGCTFPCGPQGPVDGTIGSPERTRIEEAVHAWGERGEIVPPMEARQLNPAD